MILNILTILALSSGNCVSINNYNDFPNTTSFLTPSPNKEALWFQIKIGRLV